MTQDAGYFFMKKNLDNPPSCIEIINIRIIKAEKKEYI